MGRVVSIPSRTNWVLWFLADMRSMKVREINSATDASVSFACDEDAFVSLSGSAQVVSDAAIVGNRWVSSYDRIFPTAADKANAVFIDIRTEEIRMWIRGLTPEPFGLNSLSLSRLPNNEWSVQTGKI